MHTGSVTTSHGSAPRQSLESSPPASESKVAGVASTALMTPVPHPTEPPPQTLEQRCALTKAELDAYFKRFSSFDGLNSTCRWEVHRQYHWHLILKVILTDSNTTQEDQTLIYQTIQEELLLQQIYSLVPLIDNHPKAGNFFAHLLRLPLHLDKALKGDLFKYHLHIVAMNLLKPSLKEFRGESTEEQKTITCWNDNPIIFFQQNFSAYIENEIAIYFKKYEKGESEKFHFLTKEAYCLFHAFVVIKTFSFEFEKPE